MASLSPERKLELAAYRKQWRKDNYARDMYNIRNADLKKKYNITIPDYEKLLEEQNGVCGICKKNGHQKTKLAVDHCHDTNLVRGLLCLRCNTKLDWYLKNQNEIKEYMEKFKIKEGKK